MPAGLFFIVFLGIKGLLYACANILPFSSAVNVIPYVHYLRLPRH
jgi:hypothetical protein